MKNPLLKLMFLSLMLISLACAGSKTESPQVGYANPPDVEIKEQDKPKRLTFSQEMTMADNLRDSGQFPEAAWHYIRSIQLNEENPIPKERLGYLQLSRDVHRAERIFSELVVDHPKLATGHLGLGLAKVATGELDVARPALLRAIELDPDLAASYLGMGMIHDKRGEHEQAQAQYELARERDPNRYEIHNNLGMSFLMSEDYARAVKSFRDAIYLEPRDATLYNNLAMAAGRQGDYATAYDNFRRHSSDADALNNLGYVSLMNHDFERAIRYFERSLLEGPTMRSTVLVNMRIAEDAMLTAAIHTD